MVTVRIYLSTTSRIKTNPEDWDESFTGGNLAKFTKIIEKESYKIAQGFSYGSAPKSQTFSCEISAIPYYITQFESYDYIRVDKVTNGIAKTVFIGSEPTFQRTVETADWWSETVTFTDNLSKIEDKTFNSDKDWTWKITSTDGYKICDPSDTSKSLLHVLFNTYLNADNLFTLHCDYSDTLNVTYFCVQGEDKVVDVWQDFLEQQGLAYYLLCNDLYIIDILEDKSITATTVTNIEEKATIDDKPYVEKKVPTIKRPTTITKTNKEVYNSTDITIPAFGGWFPSADMGIDVTPSYDNLGDNQEVLRYYNMRWEFWASYKYNPELWIYNGDTKSKATNGSGNGTITGSKFKYAIHGDDSYVVSTQGNLRLYADVDILDYSQKTQPDVEYRSDDEEEADYIYDEAHAKRYIQALIYSKEMSAKTYSFYSTKDLSLNEICVINGFTKEGEYVRITDKQDNLDDFEGYTYKGTVYKGTQVSVSSSYVGYSAKEPYVNQDFNFNVSRTLIVSNSAGIPLDTTPIIIKITLLQYFAIPTLTIDGITVQLIRGTEIVEGQEKMLNSWHYEFTFPFFENPSCTLQAQLGDKIKVITLERVAEGTKGTDGANVEIQYTYSASLFNLESGDTSWGEGDIFWGDKDVTWITWTTTAPAEKEGYYIWIRTRVGNGEWQYSRLTGAHAQLCEITCDKSVVIRNDRLTTSEVYTFTADIQGYINKTVKIYLNSEDKTSVCTKNGHKYILVVSVPHANATSMTAIVCLDGVEMDSVTLTLVNETDYFQFQGTMTSAEAEALPIKIKGDTYVDTDNNAIMYYNGQNWQAFSLSLLDTKDASMAGQILSSAEEAYWKLYSTMTDEQKTELFRLYGYKSEVISRFIASEKIQMYGDGVIASSSISTDPSGTIDSRGFLTEQGYRFEGLNGIARVNTAYLSSVYIDAFSKIFGEIQSEALATHNGAYVQGHFKSSTIKNTKYWSYADLRNAIPKENRATFDSTYGTYNGNTVYWAVKLTDMSAVFAKKYLACLCLDNSIEDIKHYYEAVEVNYNKQYSEPLDPSKYEEVIKFTEIVTGDHSWSWKNTVCIGQSLQIAFMIMPSGKTATIEVDGVVKYSKTTAVKKQWYVGTQIYVPSGSTIKVTVNTSYSAVTVFRYASTFYSCKMMSLGTWLYASGGGSGDQAIKLPETAFQSTSFSFLGVTNEYITWEDNCYEVIDGIMQSEPTASGGYASLDETSRVQASDGTDFVPELVSWNSKAISFSNSNGKILMINKQKWFKSFSFTLDVTASSSYTKTANLTPKEVTTTIGNEDEPFNAVYAKAVFVQNASGEWVKIEV